MHIERNQVIISIGVFQIYLPPLSPIAQVNDEGRRKYVGEEDLHLGIFVNLL